MSVTFPATTAGLTRASGIAAIGSTWSRAFWWNMAARPTGSAYLPLWSYGDPARSDPYVAVDVVVGGIQIKTWDGATQRNSSIIALPDPAAQWRFLHLWYDGTVLHLWGRTYVTGLLTVNLGAFVFVATSERLGYDTSGGSKIAGLSVAEENSWPDGNVGTNANSYNFTATEAATEFYAPLGTSTLRIFVGLSTTSDLTDQGYPGTHGWSLVGSPTTSTSGPFSLVVPFVDSFDYASIPNWNRVSVEGVTANLGCRGTSALACAETDMFRHVAPSGTEGTVRFLLAIPVSASPGQTLLITREPIRDSFGTLLGTRAAASLRAFTDGDLKLTYVTLAGSTIVAAGPGTVPITGAVFGVQWTWKITATQLFYEVKIRRGTGSWTTVITATGSSIGLTFQQWNNVLLEQFNACLLDDFYLSSTYQDWDLSMDICGGGLFCCACPAPTPPADVVTYPIRRLRRFMLPWDDANRMKFLSRLEIILQAGIGTADISNPTVMLRLSKDGGKTWGTELQMQAGELGAYSTRVYANRLGRGRNWVAEITVSDPVDWQMLQCLIDYEEGTA